MSDRCSVHELTIDDGAAWDDFVLRSSRASPYHLLGWRQAIVETYGYRSHYLVAKSDGKIAGVLPLIEIRSRLLGDALTSLPGGVCAETPKVAEALVEAAAARADTLGVDYLALRDTLDPVAPGLATINQHAVFVLGVPSDSDEVLATLPSNMRRQVRQGLNRGVQVTSGRDDLWDFYRMFARFTRDVGTPVFSADFLERVADALAGHWMVVCVRDRGRVVGGGFQVLLGDTVWGLWGGALHESLPLRPNHLLVWGCLCYAAEHGFPRLNFGRSRIGSGQHKFKRQWGGTAHPLYQHFSLLQRESIPGVLDGASPSRARRLFVGAWRRLPLPFACWLGPKLRQHIPFG
ncbi:MAG: GNAT family N-acetyltransferase [Anaerolineae bacterium]